MKEATVVCRQLGFLGAQEAKNGSAFGKSEHPIVMDRVSCKGTERRLSSCPFVCNSAQQCNGTQLAGVVCKPSKISFHVSSYAASISNDIKDCIRDSELLIAMERVC